MDEDEDEDEDCLHREKWVRIMADYGAEGIWDKRGFSREPESIPLSSELSARVYAWQDWYDRECTDYLPENQLDVVAFAAEGLAIAHAVKAALPDWTVIYLDEARFKEFLRERTGKPVWPEDRTYYEYEIFLPLEDGSRNGGGRGV